MSVYFSSNFTRPASGECRNSQGDPGTDRLFTGQRFDEGTGLYYYGARYYDPLIGRFISADTVIPDPMNPQAFNRYAYCYNNPLKYVDPSGNIVTINGVDINYIDYLLQHPELLIYIGSSSVLVDTIIEYVEIIPTYRDFSNDEQLKVERMEDSATSYEVSLETEDPLRLCFKSEYSTTYYKYKEQVFYFPFRKGDKWEGAWDQDYSYGKEPLIDLSVVCSTAADTLEFLGPGLSQVPPEQILYIAGIAGFLGPEAVGCVILYYAAYAGAKRRRDRLIPTPSPLKSYTPTA